MDAQFKQHDALSWSELMPTNIEAAKAFYTQLFGWTLEDIHMEGMPHTIIKAGDSEVGCIIPPEAKRTSPKWGTYVTVDDVDSVARAATELGATLVIEPCDITEVGRFCIIRDPQGAFISAITYTECTRGEVLLLD
jgi:predicted enzyme related to lactoylglutathione lyase